MTNPKDTLNQYAQNAEIVDEEHAAQHAANRHEGSHLDFFKGKAPKMSVVADDEDPIAVAQTLAQQKQTARRVASLSSVVQDALINRVTNPTGSNVRHVTYDEFEKMRKDPDFKTFSQYMNLILNYADGTARERPLRPFLEHEVGMYKNQIVCLKNNPGDGQRTGKIMPVGVQLERPAWDRPQPTAEPDPFPERHHEESSPLKLVKGGQK